MRFRLLLTILIFTILVLAIYQLREKDITTFPAAYPDLGPAPELSNDNWFSTDKPLRLAGLRGKVVLVDMWTFG
jgi:hypothetical protein